MATILYLVHRWCGQPPIAPGGAWSFSWRVKKAPYFMIILAENNESMETYPFSHNRRTRLMYYWLTMFHHTLRLPYSRCIMTKAPGLLSKVLVSFETHPPIQVTVKLKIFHYYLFFLTRSCHSIIQPLRRWHEPIKYIIQKNDCVEFQFTKYNLWVTLENYYRDFYCLLQNNHKHNCI